ncbi:MAG TPA: VOC family protein [Anaerolinea sp.]|nr:VOC family protein [Anaerolinea sp.]
MSLSPWLFVRGAARAVAFYQSAFGAVEVYHLEDPDGNIVSRLSLGGSEFWISDESPENANFSPQTLGGATLRLILTDPNPDALFARALAAGAKQVFPMMEEHGWRLGRVVDPFGHHWEIGWEIGNQ